jgi:enamine deaminase RidA (YjgF/YER057c/UK114 family)
LDPRVEPDAARVLQPAGWPIPKGYANGMTAEGRIVVTGGMIGWDQAGLFSTDFVVQAGYALRAILAVLVEGGAGPQHLVRLTWYVTDIETYLARAKELGRVYRDVLGSHYPAMALVQVVRLVEREAQVEIEATAVIPR